MKLFSRLGRVGCISPSAEYITVNQEMEKLIPAVVNFSFALLRECSTGSNDENVFISPFSISTALAMTAVGAGGTSKSQILDVLNMAVDVSDEELQQFFHSLVKESLLSKSTCSLQVANGMFVQQNYEILEKYRSILRESFQAEEKSLDFGKDESRIEINQWVENITREKIKDLIPTGCIDGLTRLVLVNAVYFKGMWSQPFEPSRTFKSPFHVSSNVTTEVDMMHVTADLNYLNYADLHCSCLELPYTGDNVSMVIILPDEVDGLKELEEKMTCDILQNLLGSMYKRTDVQVYLPKFKIESSLTLEKILAKMGMVDVFGDAADLSGITGNRDLKVSSVIHKSFIEVNEEGTEAAAATAIVMRLMCAMVPTEFVVNHPFLLIIRNRKSGNILFMGSIKKL